MHCEVSAAAALPFVLSQSGQSKMLLDFVRYPGGREGRIISGSECQIEKELTQNPRIKKQLVQGKHPPLQKAWRLSREGQDRYGWGLLSVSQTLGNSLRSQSWEYHNF